MSQQAKRFRPDKPRHMRNAITAREFDAERNATLRTRRFVR